jgi:tetratricopeptide (TPR) repeat protein
MITFNVGNTDKPSLLAGQAQAALQEGDTARAQSLFREAAEDFERQISGARKQSDKHMLRFLAASQYYHGGLYTEAQRFCRRIQASLLPSDVRPIFQMFVRDVNDRADPGYRERIRATLLRHFQKDEPQGILDLLKSHPHVLPPADLAFIRAASCEQIEDYKAAALFFADAIRFAPDRPALAFALALMPIRLIHDGKLDDAWAYVTDQLRAIPHAITSINASLVHYHQASQAVSLGERRTFSVEQIRYFEDAWQQFQLLPPSLQGNAELRDYMVLCFEAAAFGYLRLDQPEAARELNKKIIAFFPGESDPLMLHVLATSSVSSTIEEVGKEYLNRFERIHSNVNRSRKATVQESVSIAA